MATRANSPRKKKSGRKSRARPGTRLRRLLWRAVIGVFAFIVALVLLFSVIRPPTTHTILAEQRRLGSVERDWVRLSDIAPSMLRAVVAAEDANFCRHWGFDVAAIRAAMDSGGRRGGSTLSQQVVKNVFLWQGRSWPRKALEALLTPLVELTWSKRRILEVYLNVAEMGEGVFGVEAAARKNFGVSARDLNAQQAALIATALPDPRNRNPGRPSNWMQRRAAAIVIGAATIAADGRANCFED